MKRIIGKHTLALVFAAAMTMAPTAVHAADQPAPIAATLTLDEARTLALSRSQSLKKALLAVDSSTLTEKAQSYSMGPVPSVSVGGTLSYPGTSNSQTAYNLGVTAELSVSQTIYQGGKNSILAAIDSLATSSARAQAKAEYLAAVESADNAYYSVLEAQAAVEAAQEDLADAQAQQALAQAKFDSGMVIQATVIEAQAGTMAKETALSQAQKALQVAVATLKYLTGVSGNLQAVDFSTYDPLMAKITGMNNQSVEAFIKSLEDSAAKNNPDIEVAALASSQAEKQVDLAKAAYSPTVSASFNHTASYSATKGLDLAASGSLAITATLPLDFYTTANSVAIKNIAAQEASISLSESTDSLNLQIESAVYSLISSVRSVSSSEKALEYAQSNYQVAVELYKLSKASLTDLSAASLLVSTNRSSLIAARYSFLAELSSLRTLAGLSDDSLLIGMVK